MSMFYPKCGSEIKKNRVKKGLTQKDLAKLLNVTQQTIAYYENCNSISINKLSEIANALQIPIEKLIDSHFEPIEIQIPKEVQERLIEKLIKLEPGELPRPKYAIEREITLIVRAWKAGFESGYLTRSVEKKTVNGKLDLENEE